jgi:aminomethyltransferase
MEAGAAYGITPVGLGARDTLRFEAGLPLYGNELSETISPVEAGLKRFIKLEKSNFIGKARLLKSITEGVSRRLIGVRMIDRGVPRSGYQVFKDDRPIGFVTSGTYCPTLGENMAMALIETDFAQPNIDLTIDIRGKKLLAKTVKIPFYTRPKGDEKR